MGGPDEWPAAEPHSILENQDSLWVELTWSRLFGQLLSC